MKKSFITRAAALTIAAASIFTACGDDTTAGVTLEDNGLAENEISSSSTDDASSDSAASSSSGAASFSGKISGVTQKGPFLVGSAITLHELEGASYASTGRSFPETIKNDKGEFEISFKNLSSNYALLIADGYYRNENTGKKSTAPIKLNALSDLTDRKTVNVNLLTHLEYNRAKFLILDKGMNYAEAKAQAEKEILAAFGMSEIKDASAEDLSIFGESENDAALLALSVLMQGTSSEGEFSERLALIAQDLEKDGTIDDKQVLTDIADEAFELVPSEIKQNILNWKLSSSVPEFEGAVNKYWTDSYGIGACTEANLGSTAVVKNELSANNGKTLVCDKVGTDKIIMWRKKTSDEDKYGICTSNDKNLTFAKDDKFFICEDATWKSVKQEVYDAYSVACDADGDLKKSETSGIYYVCQNGKATTPTFTDLSMDKEFEANIWNGAKDSKLKFGEGNETDWVVSDNESEPSAKIYNSRGEKLSDGNLVQYDSEGKASTLADKGILLSYEFDLNFIKTYAFAEAIATLNSSNSSVGLDISDWEGVCIVYASSTPLHVAMTEASTYSYNIATIPASPELTVANLKWEELNQAAGNGKDALKIAKNAGDLYFGAETQKANSDVNPANKGVFYIGGIGKYNGCSIK